MFDVGFLLVFLCNIQKDKHVWCSKVGSSVRGPRMGMGLLAGAHLVY